VAFTRRDPLPQVIFPTHFTVQQAFYAAAIELIKVLIISLPLVLVVVVCLRLLRPCVVRSERNEPPVKTLPVP